MNTITILYGILALIALPFVAIAAKVVVGRIVEYCFGY